MSLTKRYLESLPKEEQNAILGAEESGVDADYEAWWASREAENEPEETMNDLEKLIADSIEARDAKIAEAEAAHLAQEARYTAIFNSIVEEVIELVKETIPAPLGPYLKYTGGMPFLREGLDARTWYPDWLYIQAPGLAEIAIGINRVEGAIYLGNITTGGVNLKSSEWPEVIAAAFDHYRNQRREYSEAARGL